MFDQRLKTAEHDIFERIGFLTRYTANDYHVAMSIPIRDLYPYVEAVSTLVEQEAAAMKPTGGG